MTQRSNESGVAACAAVALMLAGCATGQSGYGGNDNAPFASEPACQSLIPASQGGPMPTGDVAVLRWLGTSNYELAYHGKVDLMDTYYERPARTASLGFTSSRSARRRHPDRSRALGPHQRRRAGRRANPRTGGRLGDHDRGRRSGSASRKRRRSRSPATNRCATATSRSARRTSSTARSRTG